MTKKFTKKQKGQPRRPETEPVSSAKSPSSGNNRVAIAGIPWRAPESEVEAALHRKLLSLGGERVAPWYPDEELYAALLRRGELFTLPIKVRQAPGQVRHHKAAKLWDHDPWHLQLVTGFALWDGIWAEHSWVVDARHLYETMIGAKKYFGIKWTHDEAAAFFCAHWLPQLSPLHFEWKY
jgi:hypothetical protein